MNKYYEDGCRPSKVPEFVARELNLADTALTIARAELKKGVKEEYVMGKDGKHYWNNWGDDVEGYLKSVGITFPAAWCMAFVYWCFNEAAKEMKVDNPLVKTAGVLNQWNKVGRQYKKKEPVRGCIFIMDYGKGRGHTGIVESVDGDYIKTIEGNTNDEGSREGYEIARRKRKISSCKGFIVLEDK